MTHLNCITLEEVLRGLDQLGIPFEFIGPKRGVTKVCSLLHREPGGLYYYVGDDVGVFASLKD